MTAMVLDDATAVRERLETFADEVLTEAVNRPMQLLNGRVYLRVSSPFGGERAA
jgi:hypothetical protein